MAKVWVLLAVTVLALAVCPGSTASAKEVPFPSFVVNGFSNANGDGFWLAYFNGSVPR
jgi:hypothetical protein